jgi:hypothetical protein
MLPYGDDITRHILMDRDATRRAIYMAILLNIGRLPQMKGKGKSRDSRIREQGIEFFSNAVADDILHSNMVLLQGPPNVPHSIGG